MNWEKKSKDEVIAVCFDIIIFDKFKHLKMCFYEFGKIEELECMRRLLYTNFPNCIKDSCFDDPMPYDEFIKNVYTKGIHF